MLTILVGKSRFKVRGLPAEDFPTLPEIGEVDPARIPFRTFRTMISKIFYAISSEESRFQLSGALLELKPDTLVLVATDGHRLALVESVVEGLEEAEGVLVPRKTLQELQRFEGDDLEFRKSEHHLSFTVGRRSPDPMQLIPHLLAADERTAAGRTYCEFGREWGAFDWRTTQNHLERRPRVDCAVDAD